MQGILWLTFIFGLFILAKEMQQREAMVAATLAVQEDMASGNHPDRETKSKQQPAKEPKEQMTIKSPNVMFWLTK